MNTYWDGELGKYIKGKVDEDDKIAALFRERFGDDVPIVNTWRDVAYRKVTFTFEATMLNSVLVAANLVYPPGNTMKIELGAYNNGGSTWWVWNGYSCDDEVAVEEGGSNFYEACLQVANNMVKNHEESCDESYCTLISDVLGWVKRNRGNLCITLAFSMVLILIIAV